MRFIHVNKKIILTTVKKDWVIINADFESDVKIRCGISGSKGLAP